MKYFFRIVSILFLLLTPFVFIAQSWNDRDYIRLIVWIIILISNFYLFKEFIDLINFKLDKKSNNYKN